MKVHVKEGLRVLDPRTHKPLVTDDKGNAEVPENSYWLRRLRSGDVTEVEEKSSHGRRVVPKEGE